MTENIPRDRLIEIIGQIMKSEGSEEEINEWINILENNVPHPAVSDLIFHGDRELTPEEVLNAALSYQSIRL
jgi:hypothetical protein